jgi:non-ribosomal peptide synthetase-like protein
VWFVERLVQVFHVSNLAGTPWAAWYARACGARVGNGVHLRTLPPPTRLVTIGEEASIEADCDLHGWWIDGTELVVGEIRIGAGAHIGARSMLMPGADIGAGADIEPGSVVSGTVPAGECWSGSPARPEGTATERWPCETSPPVPQRRLWQTMYGAGIAAHSIVRLLAALPCVVLLLTMAPTHRTRLALAWESIGLAPALAALYLVTYALLIAMLFRGASRLVRAGWHADDGSTAWAIWFQRQLLEASLLSLFPLYMSIYTRIWLRLLGIRVGPRTEMSHAVTINGQVTVGETSFAADDVGYLCARARAGWLHVAPIEVGDRTFLGNSALLRDGTRLGDEALIGVLSLAPHNAGDGTAWFGTPPLELPRVPERLDPSRTTNPPRRLVFARGATELVRILFPSTASVVLVALLFLALDRIGATAGLGAMLAAAPVALFVAGMCAASLTIAAKWLIIGRYRPGDHPLWSFFVWRDEIINSCQEQLAGAWLLKTALGTPLMPAYLRAMGAKVGKGVWFETLNVTEFDVVHLGDGCVVNRLAHIETHLFQDRLMRIGTTRFGPRATLGPSSAVLPDTTLGTACSIGGRSVVLRGEELPPGTRWHGAPVVPMS